MPVKLVNVAKVHCLHVFHFPTLTSIGDYLLAVVAILQRAEELPRVHVLALVKLDWNGYLYLQLVL